MKFGSARFEVRAGVVNFKLGNAHYEAGRQRQLLPFLGHMTGGVLNFCFILFRTLSSFLVSRDRLQIARSSKVHSSSSFLLLTRGLF